MKEFVIKRSVTFKIGFLYVILAFINIVIIVTLIAVNQADLITDNIMLNSDKEVNQYVKMIDSEGIKRVHEDFKLREYHWSQFSGKGEIIASGGIDEITPENKMDIKKLLLLNKSGKKRYLISLDLKALSIENYIAIYAGSEKSDVIYFTMPITRMTNSLKYMAQIIIIAIFLSIMVNLITAYVLYRLVVKPIYKISNATKIISTGDYNHSINVNSQDEFGLVAYGFNQMTGEIKSNIEDMNLQMDLLKEAKHRIEIMASTDELTQILNRRALFEKLDEGIALAHRYEQTLGLIMFDIDHFKAVNDTYGHHAGDVVLQMVSERLKKTIRKVDYMGRYGGEEFVMAFPKTDLESLFIVAEKIRRAIEELKCDTGDEILNVTISLGITEYSVLRQKHDNITPESFINFADSALYVAKDTGRNKVEMTNG